MLQRLPSPEKTDEPWLNGAGRTTVLAVERSSQAWRWRISIAHIDRSAPFSALPGVARQMASLDACVDLRFADARQVRLARLEVARFAGDPPPFAELPEGPTRAFNLMTRDWPAILLARTMVDSLLLPAAPAWLLHGVAGDIAVYETAGGQGLPLRTGESIQVEGQARLEGQGEIVLVRFDRWEAPTATRNDLTDPGAR